MSGGHGEKGFLLAETEKSIHQLLLLGSRVAQMESFSQGFEFRGRKKVQSLSQILQVAFCGLDKQNRNRGNQVSSCQKDLRKVAPKKSQCNTGITYLTVRNQLEQVHEQQGPGHCLSPHSPLY